MVRSSSPGHGPQGADIALAPVLSELGCACSHLRGLVGFLREHGHRSSDAQKPIPFYGIGSVTKVGRARQLLFSGCWALASTESHDKSGTYEKAGRSRQLLLTSSCRGTGEHGLLFFVILRV